MVTTLTVSFEEFVIDEYPMENLQVALQIQSKSVKFTAPFKNLVIKSASLMPEDFLYILFSTKVEEIGQTQISLENLKHSKIIEKQVQITKLTRSPEKYSAQKILSIGRCRVLITCKEEDSEEFSAQQGDIVAAYQAIKEIFENFWEISVADSPEIENLGLAVINNEKYIKKIDFDHLRVLATGLNEKIKAIPVLQKQLEGSIQLSNKYFAMYEQVLSQITTQKQELEQINRLQSAEYEQLLKSLQSISREKSELEQTINSYKYNIDQLQSNLDLAESQLSISSSKIAANESLEKLVDQLKLQINELESCRAQLHSELAQTRQDSLNLTEAFSAESDSLLSTIDSQSNQIKSLTENCLSQEDVIESQSNEILSLNLQIENYHKQICAYSDIEENLLSEKKNYSALHGQFNNLQEAYTACSRQFSEDLRDLSDEKEKICDLSRDIQQENMKLQTSILKFSNELNQSKTSQSSLLAELAKAQQLSKQSEDLGSLSNTLLAMQDSAESLYSGVYKELEFVAEYLLGQSEQNMLNIRTMNRICSGNQDKENEILVLREMVSDLQRRRAIYYPYREDPIDTAIADYVNTRGTDVPFTREDHGIYVFGSKRVFIKLENGRVVSK